MRHFLNTVLFLGITLQATAAHALGQVEYPEGSMFVGWETDWSSLYRRDRSYQSCIHKADAQAEYEDCWIEASVSRLRQPNREDYLATLVQHPFLLQTARKGFEDLAVLFPQDAAFLRCILPLSDITEWYAPQDHRKSVVAACSAAAKARVATTIAPENAKTRGGSARSAR
jgi:hypothetical protein